MPKKS
jgi:hypothetical protein